MPIFWSKCNKQFRKLDKKCNSSSPGKQIVETFFLKWPKSLRIFLILEGWSTYYPNLLQKLALHQCYTLHTNPSYLVYKWTYDIIWNGDVLKWFEERWLASNNKQIQFQNLQTILYKFSVLNVYKGGREGGGHIPLSLQPVLSELGYPLPPLSQ